MTNATPSNEPPAAADDATAPAETPRKALDLSLPADLEFDDDLESGDTVSERNFDARPLFRNQESGKLSIQVAPTLAKPDDEESRLPTVDGGSVSLEVQTR